MATVEHRPHINRNKDDQQSFSGPFNSQTLTPNSGDLDQTMRTSGSLTQKKKPAPRKMRSMADHLQRHQRMMTKKPFETAMAVSTDPSFYEVLAHKKRSNVCFNDFARRTGREDNFVYNISEGYNLRGNKDSETHFDQFLAMRLA